MKTLNLLKSITFLSTLFIIVLLTISNQKQYTKYKILIWSTPSLPIGTYVAISTGSGFIISYLLTNSLITDNKNNTIKELKYKPIIENDEPKSYGGINYDANYDNVLIEREINEPSPTINASFRVIGNTKKINKQYQNNEYNKFDNSDFSKQSEEDYYDDNNNTYSNKENNTYLNDWDDDRYVNW